jgi:hypothetical protein
MLTFMTQIDNLFLVQKTIIPRLKSWIRKVVLEEEDDSVMKTNTKLSLAEEAAAAAKAAAAAAADVARASQEMLNSKNEGGIVIELLFFSFPALVSLNAF